MIIPHLLHIRTLQEMEKKVDNNESSQSKKGKSKDKMDDQPSDSEGPKSDEVNKMLSDNKNAEKKKANGNDESKDGDESRDKAQSTGEKNKEKKTDGGNDSVKAKSSEPSKDKAPELSDIKESQPSSKDDAEEQKGNIDEPVRILVIAAYEVPLSTTFLFV